MFFTRTHRIHLDYASLTPIDKRVLTVMKNFSSKSFANPSSWYKEGVSAKKAVDEARKNVAQFLAARPDEITFTSGGTEGNNMAILGVVENLRSQDIAYEDMHIIISAIEHSSVRECASYLSERGVKVDMLSVSSDGIVNPDDLKKMIRPNTALVSIMTVNNEIGSIMPIRELAKVIRHAREQNSDSSIYNFQDIKYPLFHTDAAQAGYQELNVDRLGVDMLTLDGSKIYGPRGVGALYVRRNLVLAPIVHGGGQEKGKRSGTENLPGIMGFAKAIELVKAERENQTKKLHALRNFFVAELKSVRPDTIMRGNPEHVSPHILNVEIPGLDSEFFVLQLDAKGVMCSTKSSCLRDEDESYVLKAIGAHSRNSVRFSFGRFTTMGELKRAVKVIGEVIKSKY